MTQPIDRNAIDRLVVEHLSDMTRMALRLESDAHAAEDLVQETLCRILRQWKSFRGEAAFKTWALRILINVNRDRRRRPQVFQPMEMSEVVSRSDQPAELAVAAELSDRVRTAVDALPDRQREVALLAWGEGLAARESASVLGITEANVYACLHLARKRIAEALGAGQVSTDQS